MFSVVAMRDLKYEFPHEPDILYMGPRAENYLFIILFVIAIEIFLDIVRVDSFPKRGRSCSFCIFFQAGSLKNLRNSCILIKTLV